MYYDKLNLQSKLGEFSLIFERVRQKNVSPEKFEKVHIYEVLILSRRYIIVYKHLQLAVLEGACQDVVLRFESCGGVGVGQDDEDGQLLGPLAVASLQEHHLTHQLLGLALVQLTPWARLYLLL